MHAPKIYRINYIGCIDLKGIISIILSTLRNNYEVGGYEVVWLRVSGCTTDVITSHVWSSYYESDKLNTKIYYAIFLDYFELNQFIQIESGTRAHRVTFKYFFFSVFTR